MTQHTDLTTALQEIVDEIAPMKDIRVKGNSKPWFDSDIMEAIRVRDKLKEKFLRTKLHVDHERFKEQRNSVQQKIKNKKTNFVRNQLQKNTKKPKELWKVLKNIGLPSKAAPISKICLKENEFTQFSDIQNANTFKNFYSKLASNLVEKLPTAKNIFRENSVKKYYSAMNIPSNSFKFRNAKREEIYKILINIDPNKAYGIDEIPGRFLKDGVELLTDPLCKIINLSLSSKFPLMCKTAKVKPVYKKGKNTEPKNYRPVSLLPILSKIIERVVYNQLIEHLEKHDILYKYQSGFRSKHSVNTCLAHLSNQILKGFESGKSTGMILIDLQKAFDTLDHDILLDKMKYLGFTSKNNRLIWFLLKKTKHCCNP